jgi:hypothetical protein
MSLTQINARVNWTQVAAIVVPLALAGFGFARSVDQRVTRIEERLNTHAELPTHPDSERRLSKLESQDATLTEHIRNIEQNQQEIKVLLRELTRQINDDRRRQ